MLRAARSEEEEVSPCAEPEDEALPIGPAPAAKVELEGPQKENSPASGAVGADGAPLALIACRICQEPIRRSVSSIRADACCHICYTGLWRDAIRVAAALKRHRSLSVPGTSMGVVLDLFKHEMTQVGKPCVRTDGSCVPSDYHYSTPRIRRCTRCRTKAAIELFPEVAYRLLSKAHQSLLKAEHNRRKNSDGGDSSSSDGHAHARPRHEGPARARADHHQPSPYSIVPGSVVAAPDRAMRAAPMTAGSPAPGPMGPMSAEAMAAAAYGMGMMPGMWGLPWGLPPGYPPPMPYAMPGSAFPPMPGSSGPMGPPAWPMMFMPPGMPGMPGMPPFAAPPAPGPAPTADPRQ